MDGQGWGEDLEGLGGEKEYDKNVFKFQKYLLYELRQSMLTCFGVSQEQD